MSPPCPRPTTSTRAFPTGRRLRACSLAAALLAAAGGSATAADQADIEQVRATTLKLIDLLVEQGVLTRAKADEMLKQAQQAGNEAAARHAAATPAAAPGWGTPAASAPSGTVRVPYVPEFMRKELKEEIRQELVAQAQAEGWAGPGAVPGWVRSLQWDGDLRFRVQGDEFGSGNAPAVNVMASNSSRSIVALNTTEDRTRLRVRARLGLTAQIDDHWSSAVRITTGSLTDPVSSNQTLGTYNDRYTIAFDRAYLRYQYGDDWNVVFGRFGNPWFGTDLVWAPDLSFDGVAAQWSPKLGSRVRGFATVAAMPIQEVELSAADKWLFGAQIGANMPGSADRIGAKLGVAYYEYRNITGQLSPADAPTLNEFTAPAYAQKGNTYYNISSDPSRPLFGLAAGYKLVNVTGTLDFPLWQDKRVMLTADYVRNVGYDSAAVSARLGTNVEAMTTGYLARVAFGNPELRRLHDWQVFATYKYLERDAVLDAFTDSDFHLGGTDARGYILGASYGLGKDTYATLRYLSADSITSVPLAIDVIQFDLNVRF